jgi:hypothetical protein
MADLGYVGESESVGACGAEERARVRLSLLTSVGPPPSRQKLP